MHKKPGQLLVAMLFALVPVHATGAEVGDVGALFLRLGMGGRASAMGEAFTGVAKDASAVYWNPGAMSAVLGTNAMFMHNEYLQSIRLEQAALTHETEYGTLGLSFTGLYMDEMDRYEDSPSAIPLGTFSAYDVSFALAFSRYVLPNLAIGVSGKTVYQNIDESTAKGFAFDAGLYHVARVTGVKFSAVITNVGKPLKFEDDQFIGDEFTLPRVFKIGASFERRYPSLHGGVLATLDFVFPNDGDAKQHIGFEYNYLKKLFLRSGFKAGYDSQGATFGAGVKLRQFDFDYAVLLIGNDLGDSHRFGFSIKI